MQQDKPRLISLDGIRGLAMILVFLNHINPSYIVNLFPTSLQILIPTIFSSGVLGVSFLFILTGFLMAYIYPNPSNKLLFLQKRYTRIFPLFVTMCIVTLILRNIPNVSFLATIPLIIIFGMITYVFWVKIIKKIDSKFISRTIFILFLLFQIIVGLIYTFVIIKFPPIFFNQQIPAVIRETIIGFVNITLTLPLGNYIPMLDGVYWSLTSEILFYILYPIICVPFIIFLSTKNKFASILFLITLFPLFAGMDILSHKILVINMLQISLFSYFVVGMLLGYIYKNKYYLLEKLDIFKDTPLKYLSILFFIFTLILPHFLQEIIPSEFHPWINLLWALPFGLVIALAIDSKTTLSKILSSRFLVFIGLISYSIYLTHTPILHMMQGFFAPWNVLSNLLFVSATFVVTVFISIFLYKLVEKPYFIKSKNKDNLNNSKTYITKKKIGTIFIFVIILYFVGVFFAYQSDFNFFSIEYPYSSSVIDFPKTNEKYISLNKFPKISMQIAAYDNYFGVITMHIAHKTIPNQKGDLSTQLIFKIKEKGSKDWYSISKYDLYRIKDSIHHPFGFPVINNSKNKIYTVELSLSKPKSPEYILFDTTDQSIKSVYPVNKMQLIKNPVNLLKFTQNRIINVFYNNEARYVIILFIPFVLALSYLIFL